MVQMQMEGFVARQTGAVDRLPLFRSAMQLGFECAAITWPRGPWKNRRQDMQEGTGHLGEAVRAHYEAGKALGVLTFRSGIPWHKVLLPGRWEEAPINRAFRIAAEADVEVIWDLVHFGFPLGVSPADPFFPELLSEFGRRVARTAKEYGQPLWLCVINEPTITAHFCGQIGQWGPALRRQGQSLKRKLVRAQIETIRAVRAINPDARFLHTDPYTGPKSFETEALDWLTGRSEPKLGGSEEFLDVLGINHFPHFGGPRIAANIVALGERYRRPILLAETSLHQGHPKHTGYSDRGAWLRYVVDQCASARKRGVPVQGVCWYPAIDSPAWNGRRGQFWSHGLLRPDGALDQSLADAVRELAPFASSLTS